MATSTSASPSASPAHATAASPARVFVANIAPHTTSESLAAALAAFGATRDIYYPRGKGFAFVEFARADAAYVEALAVRRELLGAAHPDSIATQHNLAECRRAAGDEPGAVALQQEILRLLGVAEDEGVEGSGAAQPQDARSL